MHGGRRPLHDGLHLHQHETPARQRHVHRVTAGRHPDRAVGRPRQAGDADRLRQRPPAPDVGLGGHRGGDRRDEADDRTQCSGVPGLFLNGDLHQGPDHRAGHRLADDRIVPGAELGGRVAVDVQERLGPVVLSPGADPQRTRRRPAGTEIGQRHGDDEEAVLIEEHRQVEAELDEIRSRAVLVHDPHAVTGRLRAVCGSLGHGQVGEDVAVARTVQGGGVAEQVRCAVGLPGGEPERAVQPVGERIAQVPILPERLDRLQAPGDRSVRLHRLAEGPVDALAVLVLVLLPGAQRADLGRKLIDGVGLPLVRAIQLHAGARRVADHQRVGGLVGIHHHALVDRSPIGNHQVIAHQGQPRRQQILHAGNGVRLPHELRLGPVERDLGGFKPAGRAQRHGGVQGAEELPLRVVEPGFPADRGAGGVVVAGGVAFHERPGLLDVREPRASPQQSRGDEHRARSCYPGQQSLQRLNPSARRRPCCRQTAPRL